MQFNNDGMRPPNRIARIHRLLTHVFSYVFQIECHNHETRPPNCRVTHSFLSHTNTPDRGGAPGNHEFIDPLNHRHISLLHTHTHPWSRRGPLSLTHTPHRGGAHGNHLLTNSRTHWLTGSRTHPLSATHTHHRRDAQGNLRLTESLAHSLSDPLTH